MIPFLLGGFLYYLTNPIVNFLQKYFRINRIIGILLTLCALVWGLVIGVVYLLPILINQLTSLIISSQNIYSRLQDLIIDLSMNPVFQNIDIQQTIQQLNLSYVDILQNILNSVSNSLGSVLSALFSTVLILIMTPVFLIYFLLDGHKLLPMLERTVLKHDKLNLSSLLTNLNTTIARYISGIAIDAIIIGCLAYIGYSVIGLKYALVFAIFSGIANLIPYVGPSIGLIPMVIANVFLQTFIGSGIKNIQPCSNDSNRSSSILECSHMGGCINSFSQATDHDQLISQTLDNSLNRLCSLTRT